MEESRHKHVYGPVPSRRLGRSLGVSPIPPSTCTCSCVYCQLGRTRHLEIRRRSHYPREEIAEEVVRAVRKTRPDHVTFCGDGEPTLCRDLGWLIRQVKATVGTPVAVMTNGCLLYRMDVRQDLDPADIVIPSLDAGDDATFVALNRPHPGLDHQDVVQGLVDLREAFPGRIWLEVMLVGGVNDGEEALAGIREAVASIRPDRVFLLTPFRPPAEAWVEVPEAAALRRARETIEGAELLQDVESGEFTSYGCSGAREAVLEIGSRHPLRREQAQQIEESMGSPGAVQELLDAGELSEAEHEGRRFLLPRRLGRRGCRTGPAGRPMTGRPGNGVPEGLPEAAGE
jgi:wyosine [tRNA(Phe)-imidazoG37] synthetase (radical SAM superfamily)